MNTICKLFYKLCYVIGKYVCKAIWAICKFVWKFSKSGYDKYKEMKAVSKGSTVESNSVEVNGPDESVRITPKDKFANLRDEELRLLLDKMTDLAVKIDENPELEKVYETYGADQETFKQEIIDELKRREMDNDKK